MRDDPLNQLRAGFAASDGRQPRSVSVTSSATVMATPSQNGRFIMSSGVRLASLTRSSYCLQL